MADHAWTCADCRTKHETDGLCCSACYAPRYASWAIMVASHVVEHLGDGLVEPLAVLEAMQARPCYARVDLSLAFIAQQMRLLTKDTTALARAIVKARSSRTMLEVLETGDTKDKIAVLAKWGPETNAEHVEHKGETVTRHVVELHEGPPPKREG